MDKNILRQQINSFLAEDIGLGDLTSEAIFSPDQIGKAKLVAREPFTVAGLDWVVPEVFSAQNDSIICTAEVTDGDLVDKGQLLMTVEGPVVDLLKAERVALNLLQRLSGIATITSAFVQEVAGTKARITDTRKTTPGLRMLEKYAVTCGGGYNHRFNLADGVLIKDNHIAACGSIAEAVRLTRAKAPHTIRIEVETDTLEQVQECVECEVDIIMLDNMPPEIIREAIAIIGKKSLIEASGGVTLKTVKAIADTGVDIISIGGLTHSAPSCDIGMDWSE